MKVGNILALLALSFLLVTGFGNAAQAASKEMRVAFGQTPAAVQKSLTQYAGVIDAGTATTVWKTSDNGKAAYIGKVVALDGSSRLITVDETGNLIELRKQPASRWKISMDFGKGVMFDSLPETVRKTIAENASGRPIASVVRKTAANGIVIYKAKTTDIEGLPVYIETTMDGALVGVKHRGD